MSRISIAGWLMTATFLVSCASPGPGISTGSAPAASGPPIEAPTLKVGDRWIYNAKDGYRTPTVWVETHQIARIGSDGITVRVTLKGPTIDIQRSETWSAPGVVRTGAVYEAETDRFDPALLRYKYPLTAGETWKQSVRDLNKAAGPYGPIQQTVEVAGFESVSTPAGTFNALRMRIFMQLDDETFWRYATQCDYVVWYAPAVGAMVRTEKRSYYRNKEGVSSGTVPGQYATLELASYARGP
ncbi:MAG TPA: hypothetical protein VGL25_04335 [Casimicrobiaceae bacterium]